jgi:hypothetical protein
VILRKIPASDLFVATPELLKQNQRVYSRKSHNQQQTAKPDQQREPRTERDWIHAGFAGARWIDLAHRH